MSELYVIEAANGRTEMSVKLWRAMGLDPGWLTRPNAGGRAMTPYTPDAVNAIRAALRSGRSAESTRRMLGWDAGMFAGVCRKHGIDLLLPESEQVTQAKDAANTAAPIKPPPPVAAQGRRRRRPAPGDEAGSGRLIDVTVNLHPEIIAALSRHAARRGVSRYRAAGGLVAAEIATAGVERIRIIPPATRGAGRGTVAVSVGLEPSCATTLERESQRRRRKRESTWALVKACLVRWFERQSGRSAAGGCDGAGA
ncbi:hypothetical protein [Bradyrhizobium sp.]|uniref:hypothetical protein n=1 Tax=Bradyrhizobium sp. TaxID=376 RepID=UPI0025C22D1E|nr:hypothetical protein [Bradyrhizobium sp.]